MALYEIQFGSGLAWLYTELVEAEHEQEAVGNLIDKLEAEGSTGIVVALDEIDKMDLYDDEYIIGGNHGLALLHYGQLLIRKLYG